MRADTERIHSEQGPMVRVKQTPLGMSTTSTDEQRVEVDGDGDAIVETQAEYLWMSKIWDMVTGDSYRDNT